MGDTPGRTLQLLGLLQSRPIWSGFDLAERLDVTERTLRRDVDRLRLLGYPVEAVPGRHGGYRMGRGGNLPPLLLNDDEAVVVAIGLREAVDGTIAGLEESAVAVLAKLDQLLPTRLARRVRAVHDNTVSMNHRQALQKEERVEAAHLVLLANACSARERVRFDYTDKSAQASRRLVEPLGVVRRGARWYLVARDLDRSDWRTFRLDRISAPENIGTRFELVDPPDPVELVTTGFATMSFPYSARIRLALPLEEAAQLIPRTIAFFESQDGATIVELGSTSQERMVSYLAGLRPACEVIEPKELRSALADHAGGIVAANSSTGRLARPGAHSIEDDGQHPGLGGL